MKGRRQSGVILCSILCLMMLLCGCSKIEVPADLSVPALAITAKGQVTAWIVESFDKDYYDLEELRAMVNEEVKLFNEEHQTNSGAAAVTVNTLEKTATGNAVKLVLGFRDIAAYRDYTGKDLFYGTVTEARKAGYDLELQLISTKDGSSIDRDDIYGMGRKHILITQEKVKIYGPKTPSYVSPGAAAKEDGSVEVSEDAEDNIYIIMK